MYKRAYSSVLNNKKYGMSGDELTANTKFESFQVNL